MAAKRPLLATLMVRLFVHVLHPGGPLLSYRRSVHATTGSRIVGGLETAGSLKIKTRPETIPRPRDMCAESYTLVSSQARLVPGDLQWDCFSRLRLSCTQPHLCRNFAAQLYLAEPATLQKGGASDSPAWAAASSSRWTSVSPMVGAMPWHSFSLDTQACSS